MTAERAVRAAVIETERSDTEVFFGLLAAVRSAPRGWSTPSGRELLSAARGRLAPLARAMHAEPDDAVTAAWELWCGPGIDGADNPWAYTATAVRRALNRQEHAARLLTSDGGLRRHGAASKPSVIGELPLDLISGHVIATVEALRLPGSIAVREWLVARGLPTSEATVILATVLDSASRSSASAAAVDRISRDRGMADRFDIPHSSWRALATVILGTTRGAPGVVELTHRGHPAPLRVEYIRRATNRFHLRQKVAA